MGARVFAACALALAVVAAGAQQAYKSIGPDGRTVYSDRPPAEGKVEKTLQYKPGPTSALSTSYVEQLKRFQATGGSKVEVPAGRPALFSAAWCGYCKLAKAYLNGKGIGFTEYDIDTRDGLAAFAGAGGGKGIPLLVNGSTRLQGFSQESYDAAFAKAK